MGGPAMQFGLALGAQFPFQMGKPDPALCAARGERQATPFGPSENPDCPCPLPSAPQLLLTPSPQPQPWLPAGADDVWGGNAIRCQVLAENSLEP